MLREISHADLLKKNVHAASIRKNVVFEALGNHTSSVQSLVGSIPQAPARDMYVCV